MIKGIKEQIKANPLLYKVYFYCVRKFRGDRVALPRKGDLLYLDGFPRSGNTYAVSLINYVGANKKIIGAHHLHVIAAIKIAIRKQNNIMILIRDPVEAIASHLISNGIEKRSEKKIINYADKSMKSYINYYNYVRNNQTKIKLVLFKYLIENTFDFLLDINDTYNLNIDKNELKNIFSKAHTEYIKAHTEYIKAQSAKPSKKSNMPNAYKTAVKEKITGLIRKTSSYTEAIKVYQSLAE